MKTNQINGKTAGNSLENGRKLSAVENVFHAVKTAARTVFAASALGVLLTERFSGLGNGKLLRRETMSV